MEHIFSLLLFFTLAHIFCYSSPYGADGAFHAPKRHGLVHPNDSTSELGTKRSGRYYMQPSPRVVQGVTADGSCPYQAVLFKNGNQYGGGAIIGSRWILTAASMIDDIKITELTVGVGSDNLSDEIIYIPSNLYKHEEYRALLGTFPYNDIGLIKLQTDIKFSPGIARPIGIANRRPKVNTWATVSGFGAKVESEVYEGSPFLYKTQVKINHDSKCRKVLSNWIEKEMQLQAISISVFPSSIANVFCAVDPVKGSDTCQGDVGGPLVQGNKLSGIVSWGIRCGRQKLPRFYTDVSYFRDWILDTMASG